MQYRLLNVMSAVLSFWHTLEIIISFHNDRILKDLIVQKTRDSDEQEQYTRNSFLKMSLQ